MNSGPVNATCDLLLTAIDLTRACCANEHYLTWLSYYSDALHGSAGIANYFSNAALAFEEQAHPQIGRDFDVFDARDKLGRPLDVVRPALLRRTPRRCYHGDPRRMALVRFQRPGACRVTPITRKLIRVTTAKHRGDAIVIELHATALFVRGIEYRRRSRSVQHRRLLRAEGPLNSRPSAQYLDPSGADF